MTPIDPKAFRQALGNYPTGVTIVTTKDDDGTPRGLTANSFTSVSLDPPLILVCLGKTTASHPVFMQSEAFAVNFLADDQRDVSGLFASKSPDKFGQAAWREGHTGSPLIDGSVAWFDCTVHQRVDAGDHTILIGQVAEMGQRTARPLGYCQGAYVGFQLAQAAQAAQSRQARTTALIETAEGVLFTQGANGLDLPTAADAASLLQSLQAQGVAASLDFLFAVFDTPEGSRIVYRGRTTSGPVAAPGWRSVPLSDLPALGLPDSALQSMLNRYARERAQDAFGIYVGNQDEGEVRPLAAA
ncbi:flavin reductase family protein [Aquabacterium sp.]|uniref:flavin reductase family protein n=1 Tax=Aquabacterium sp. TaxID=1872578 RepID=UPI002489FB3E|nr:flavin reductase family protein [Aquabacterium sp.]MDI1347879.1 flavin reductase family protein [Aquabacterium sp.]